MYPERPEQLTILTSSMAEKLLTKMLTTTNVAESEKQNGNVHEKKGFSLGKSDRTIDESIE